MDTLIIAVVAYTVGYTTNRIVSKLHKIAQMRKLRKIEKLLAQQVLY